MDYGTLGEMDEVDSRRARYEVRIVGRLSPKLVDELRSAEITDITTGFTAEAADESALHALLRRIEALGLEIESITRSSEPGSTRSES